MATILRALYAYLFLLLMLRVIEMHDRKVKRLQRTVVLSACLI